MFESSDFAATEEGRQSFAKIVGDPDEDRDHLISISPAYRAADVNVPVLLVHGSDDRRVDMEHTYRMQVMLHALGKPYEWLVVKHASHSPTRRQALLIMDQVLRFLDAHLSSPAGN